MTEERPGMLDATTRTPCRSRVGVGLTDLMLLVMAAGVATAVVREVNTGAWFTPAVDLQRIAGVGSALLAILMGTALLRQVIQRIRRDDAWRLPNVAAVFSRVAIVGLLGLAIQLEVHVLTADPTPDPWGAGRHVLPSSLTLGIAGLVTALSPAKSASRPVSRKLSDLAVVSAAVAGIIIAANEVLIPFLVMVSLEGIRNGSLGFDVHERLGPGLPDRLPGACLESMPVLACCLGLGLVLSRELRRPVEAASPRQLRVLLGLAASAAAGSAWLLAVTVPRLDPHLLEGLRLAIDWRLFGIVIAGVAGLSLGPVTSASDRAEHPVPRDPQPRVRPWFWYLIGGPIVALLVLAFVAGPAIDAMVARNSAGEGEMGPSWVMFTLWLDAVFARIRSLVPIAQLLPPSCDSYALWFPALIFTQIWLGWRIAAMLAGSSDGRIARIEASLTDRRTAARFVTRWVAFTVLMIASVPVWFFAGLAALCVIIR